MACSAFVVSVQANELQMRGTASIAELCVKPEEAMRKLAHGERVSVLSSDIEQLRQLLRAQGVGVAIKF